MKEVINKKYHYKGYHNCNSVCGLTIIGNTVIVTELNENQGTSITNMAEDLATKICKEFNILPENLVWIERYSEDPTSFSKRLREGTYDLVSFDFKNGEFSHPTWKNISEDQFVQIEKKALKNIGV